MQHYISFDVYATSSEEFNSDYLMRFLFFVIFTFLSLNIFASGEFGGGVTFSPNISFKGEDVSIKINQDDFESYAYSVLINGSFFVERKFPKVALGIGLGYLFLNEQTEKVSKDFTTEELKDYIFNHDYGTLPMYMRIKMSKRFFLKTGITSLVNLSNNLTSVLTDVNNGGSTQAILADNTSYNLFNFSGDIGIGYTFVDKKIAMDIEPLFTKNLIGLFNGEVDANAFQSSIGVSLTIRF